MCPCMEIARLSGGPLNNLTVIIKSVFVPVLAFVVLLLLPVSASASQFELSRLANSIYLVSDQMADELRYVRNYSSVRQQAQRLAREARQLDEALRRNRSNSYVRGQFRDVTRRYRTLEEAFLRADRRNYNYYAYKQMSVLGDLYGRLWQEFNHSRFYNGSWNNTWNNSWNDPWLNTWRNRWSLGWENSWRNSWGGSWRRNRNSSRNPYSTNRSYSNTRN